MKEVVCYGAGNNASRFLPVLKQRYQIQYVIDQDTNKQGQKMYDIEIFPVDRKTVNRYPIIILVKDKASVFRTLKRLDCAVRLYCLLECMGGYGVIEYRKDGSVSYALEESDYIFSPDRFEMLRVFLNDDEVIPQKPRYFNIASNHNFYSTGGPCACLRNLWLANNEFHLLDNFYTLCPGTIYVPKGTDIDCKRRLYIDKMDLLKPYFEEDRQYTEDFASLFLYFCFLKEFLKEANDRFVFQENDVFLLQDPFIVHVFIHSFPVLQNVVAAYHMQGSAHSELGKQHPELVSVYDVMQLEHLKKVQNWIFPSKGAQEGFFRTATPEMRKAARKCNFYVAYNGYEPKKHVKADPDFIKELYNRKEKDVTFASATFLYQNKGVEKIPRVLAEFKRITGMTIRWILVGSGEMETEVEANIKQYLQKDEYVWYRKRFDNQDNIFALFQHSDFYIMMHRVSIFDLSILQAMSYGCIPFLSNVGGNLELCGYQNGILINPDDDELTFPEDIKKGKAYFENKKRENKEIVKLHFNNRQFLSSYKERLEAFAK